MSDTYEGQWMHVCGGIDVYFPRASIKFCPYCGLSQGGTKFDGKHPAVHTEWLYRVRVYNREGYRTYRLEDCEFILKEPPGFIAVGEDEFPITDYGWWKRHMERYIKETNLEEFKRDSIEGTPGEAPYEEWGGGDSEHEKSGIPERNIGLRGTVEWDIDRNLPVYTRDLLEIAKDWMPSDGNIWGHSLSYFIKRFAEDYGNLEDEGD